MSFWIEWPPEIDIALGRLLHKYAFDFEQASIELQKLLRHGFLDGGTLEDTHFGAGVCRAHWAYLDRKSVVERFQRSLTRRQDRLQNHDQRSFGQHSDEVARDLTKANDEVKIVL